MMASSQELEDSCEDGAAEGQVSEEQQKREEEEQRASHRIKRRSCLRSAGALGGTLGQCWKSGAPSLSRPSDNGPSCDRFRLPQLRSSHRLQ